MLTRGHPCMAIDMKRVGVEIRAAISAKRPTDSGTGRSRWAYPLLEGRRFGDVKMSPPRYHEVDLGAILPIEFVSIVLRRVMAGRHYGHGCSVPSAHRLRPVWRRRYRITRLGTLVDGESRRSAPLGLWRPSKATTTPRSWAAST